MADDPILQAIRGASGGTVIADAEDSDSNRAPANYAKPGPYATKLPTNDEAEFQNWVKQNKVPWQDSPASDYDMRGYWKAQQSGDPNAQQAANKHFPDTWKTPYHKTFSNESMYATPNAPHWEGDKLVPTVQADAETDDPIMSAIRSLKKPTPALRTPSLDQLATGTVAETQTPSLTARGSKLNSGLATTVAEPTPEGARAEIAREIPPGPRGPITPEESNAAAFGLTPDQVAAHDADVEKTNAALMTGSRKVPIPAFGGGSGLAPGVRMSNVGELSDLTDEYLNRPDIPKTRTQAFFAGATADAVKNLNDMFLSPLGLASTGLGLTEAIALARAGKFGAEAMKLGQDYLAMREAGASGAELAGVEQKIRDVAIATAKVQKAAVAGKVAGTGAGVTFGAQGAQNVGEGVEQRDVSKVASGLGQMALGGAALGGAHGIEGSVKAETAARAAKAAEATGQPTATRTQQIPAEATKVPQLPEGAKPEDHIGPKQENLAPESPKTLKAQTDALAKGTNKVVYFPKGTDSVPPPPENAKVTVVPGDQPGAGTWYHTEDVKPLTILKAVKNGTFGQLLGNHQSKTEAISGTAPAAVVARDDSGTEIKASLVDTAKPEIVAAQAATLQRQFPKATIGVEPAEKVVGERLGTKTKEPEKLVETAASPETPQVEKRSASSVGTPPTGTAERRLAPGPPPEQNRLLTEYRRRLAAATTPHEQETLKAQIADIQGTEGALKIGGGGEEMAAQIRAAREKSSGQPISKEAALANQEQRKSGAPRTAPVSPVAEANRLREEKKGTIGAVPFARARLKKGPNGEMAWTSDVEQAAKASADLQPIVDEHAPELRDLAEKVQHIDPPLAKDLQAVAEGKYDKPEDWEAVAGRVKDATTKAEITAAAEELRAASPAPVSANAEGAEGNEPASAGVLAANRQPEAVRETATQAGRELDPILAAIQAAPEKEPANAKSVGTASEGALEGAPPENVRGAREVGTVAPATGEGGESDLGRVQPGNRQRNGSASELGGSEGESPVPAKRGRRAASRREPGQVTRPEQIGNDYKITEADHLGEGGPKQKFTQNAEAIRLLKTLESEGRSATPAEQASLVKYTGWGWTGNALFNDYNREWRSEREQLQKLLTEDEYAAARKSTTNAHYTSPEIITAVWKALQRLGFDGGRILEPSAGIGHFLGLMPSDLAINSRKTAVELDPISGRILKQLYQTADVRIHGFEKLAGSNNFYDLAVSNVPFGDYKVHDPVYNKYKLSIHNYFIAKMLDRVRPGGIVAVITSHHTLDSLSSSTRQLFADRGDLLGAIRLPNTAFQKNAGTEVTTDLIFFRKRAEGEKAVGEPFVGTKTIEVPNKYAGKTVESFGVPGRMEKDDVTINQYFAQHPTMALGKHSLSGTMYGSKEYALVPGEQPIDEAMAAAIEKLPENAMRAREIPASVTPKATEEGIPNFAEVKPFGLTIKNGKVFRRTPDGMKEEEGYPKKSVNALKGLLGIRDTVRELFKAEIKGAAPEKLTDLRGLLNRFYDAFKDKYGPIHARANRNAMKYDPDLPLLLSLEKYDTRTKEVSKADAFSRQTISPRKPVEKVGTAKEALVVSLAERGRLDPKYMQKLTGKTPDELLADLKSQGLVFQSPEGHWETSDAYLSGNVRKKLAEAEDAAKVDPAFKDNVEALKKVQPQDLTPGEISVRLGGAWIPADDIRNFVDSVILQSYNRTRVTHVASEAIWKIDAPHAKHNANATQKWGTDRANAIDMIEGALNMKQPTIYDRVDEKTTVVNQEATLLAREKLEKIEEEFKNWIFRDPARAERLTQLYNERFNSNRLREYDGSHLSLPGSSAGITLRPHQKNAIWRAIQGGNTGFFHVVGAGKTYTVVGAAMEMRRLGLSKKPMVVVPNHLVKQWSQDFQRLYPQANVLAATKKDFEKDSRKEFMSRVATGDWDAVIVAHKSFELLPVSDELFNRIMQERIDTLVEHIREVGEAEGKKSRTVKQLEKIKARLEAKIEARANRENKDNTVTFDGDLGVDSLFVDEAHAFKNLMITSKMGNIAGIPKSDSNRAFDMYMKTKHITDMNNGKNVVFATGTPISNTMAEMYNMMRYLDERRLKEMGLEHFDAWAATFGNVVQNFEVSPEDPSRFRISNRFAKFSNLPELRNMFRSTGDVKTQLDLNLPVPKHAGNKPNVVVIPASPRVAEYVKELGARADAVRQRKVEPEEDNMLKITGDGRKAALDFRAIEPDARDEENTKINAAISKIMQHYDEGKDGKLTQLVMLDLATPNDEGRFSAYGDIKNKLVARGVPKEEVAFIHDADTDEKKQELFDRVNDGEVRVILGSTEKLGVGTNVQQRLIALHHLDSPWRPSDIEQRNGRAFRQGNTNPEVYEYRYVTEGTFDAYMWQLIETKAAFIAQAIEDGEARTIDDIDGRALSYAEAKALATGNPLVSEKIKTDMEITKLQKLQSAARRDQLNNQVKLARIPQEIAGHEAFAEKLKHDIKVRDKNKSEEFQAVIGKKTYTDRAEAGGALNAAIESNRGSSPVKVGKYAGFDVLVDGNGNAYLQGDTTMNIAANYTEPLGTVMSMERIPQGLEQRVKAREEQIDTAKKDMATRQAELDKPFEKQKQLDELLEKQKRINDSLKVDKSDPTAAKADSNVEYTKDGKKIAVKNNDEAGFGSIDAMLFGIPSLIGKAIKALSNFRARRAQPEIKENETPAEQQNSQPGGIPVGPPASARPKETAGNIRLDKLNAPEDVINEIRRMAKEHAGEFDEQRRGKQTFANTRTASARLVEEGMFTERDLKNMQAGHALNAEELLAARGMLIAQAKRVRAAAKEVRENPSVSATLKFQQELLKQQGIQKAVSGAVSEAGRALSQQRMVANALEREDKSNHQKVLDALGGQDLSEEAAMRLAQIPEDDPVALNNFLRSQKYWTTAQKIEAYWMTNILSSPRTPLKKGFGDITLALLEGANRGAMAAIDPILAAIGGRPREHYFREAVVGPLAYLSAIPEATRKGAFILAHGFDQDKVLNLEMPYRYEFPGGLKNPWNIPGRILSGVTKFFQVTAFQGELHAQAVKQALKEGLRGEAMKNRAAELVQHPTDGIVDAAMKQAQLQTYTEAPDALARVLMTLRDKVKIPPTFPLIGGLRPLGFVIPFIQIPYNLAKTGIRYSPLGALRLSDPKVWKDKKAAEIMGRALIGMGIMGLFAYLASKTALTGGAPSDPSERDEFYRSGKQAYSIKVGNRWISYLGLGPLALTAAATAGYHDHFAKKGEMPPTDQVVAMAAEMGKALLNESFLRGIKNFVDALDDPARFASKMAGGIIGGFVPMESALRTANDAIDPTVRNPKDIYERIQAGIPGISKNVPPKLDVFGRPSVKEGSGGFASLVPGGTAKAEPKSDMDAELARLHGMGLHNIGFSAKSVTVDSIKVPLDRQERDNFQKIRGAYLKSYLGELFKGPDYKGMSDEEKIQAASDAIHQASRDAHEEMVDLVLDKRLRKSASNGAPRHAPGTLALAQ